MNLWEYKVEPPEVGCENTYLSGMSISSFIKLLCDFLGDRQTGRALQSRVGTPLEKRDICRRVLTLLCKRPGIEPGGMQARRLCDVSDWSFQSENHPQLHPL